ncbi:MAG: hypothetical protein JL50_11040 [Peptococcaceae bacterium BICA1-7]|nr:MAG: hypothetical protein JL50_11040 [Peptococcaceae bacterium BICA1-7]HBV95821.1 hypothetical protein [Desulfotomaculum sp.]
MPSFDVEVEFEIYCSKCGAGLCSNGSTKSIRNTNRLDMEPCEKCLEFAADMADGEARDELSGKIQELEDEIAELKNRLEV